MRVSFISIVCAFAIAACGSTSTGTPDSGADAALDLDANFPPGFLSLAPCPLPSDFTIGTSTITAGVGGNVFAPQCLRVPMGMTLTIQASTMYPLHASTRGTSGSPIPAGPSTSDQAITFATLGLFPYYCTTLGANSGTGMSGVVWVEPATAP